jgi:hypothetical protein
VTSDWNVDRLKGRNGKSNRPRGVSEVWQGKGLREDVFGSVAMAGLTGEFLEVWQGKDLENER